MTEDQEFQFVAPIAAFLLIVLVLIVAGMAYAWVTRNREENDVDE